MGIRMGDEHLPSLGKVERVARDMRDQLDRSQHFESVYRSAILEARDVIAAPWDQFTDMADLIDQVDDILEQAIKARW